VTPAADLRAEVAEVLHAHWRDGGYTVPNRDVYPWQWLWDSCFHAVIWAELGDGERAVTELANALAGQDEDGFVPHITYHGEPGFLEAFWGRPATSSITQPPMYGHAVADLHRRGIVVPEEVVERATRGLRFLFDRRARTTRGLVTVVHPWETGCDDSPRWDGWCDPWSPGAWRERKGELLATVERTPGGAPVANPAFAVAPAGFNALLAWNALELAGVAGDERLAGGARELAESLAGQWDHDRQTWVDDGPHDSGRVRTADALLPALVLGGIGLAGLNGPFGPSGVDPREPAYDPEGYWRGGVWPQVTYLLWCAARAGGHSVAAALGEGLVTGAITSGLAEYWHPDDGRGLGAIPQSWTGLALLVRPPARSDTELPLMRR
jgi:Mannosylglycerate hydrolase MGH1-like glycoside hydrolase domain